MASLHQLYPESRSALTLRGLYLQPTQRPDGTPATPCVYANFISSLDGRIALVQGMSHKVPASIANERDWRLFQELTACADAVLTSGRYMRDLAAGAAQAGLPVSMAGAFSDLLEWRLARGMTRQPAVVIVSASLDFVIPEGLCEQRLVFVATGEKADSERAAMLENQGATVLCAGVGRDVDARILVVQLAQQGFGNIELIAGGRLLHMLLAGQCLNRLYFTQVQRLLGGETFDTIVTGTAFDRPARLQLKALFMDATSDFEQTFSIYDCQW